MKKTLSTVLSIAMLSSVAFAANPTIGTTSVISPGSEIDITIDQFKAGSTAALLAENFSISTKKFSKGSNLVKEIKIDSDDEVVRIVLNQDMALTEPKSPNLVIDTLSIKAKKETGDVARNAVLTITDIRESIGHTINTVTLGSSTQPLANDQMNKIAAPDTSTGYGYVSFDVGEMMLEGRAYDGDKIYVKGDQNANTAVLKKYPDADLRFVSVETNGFPTNFDVFLTAEKDEYIYKVSSDGKLVSSGLKWSDGEYAWTGKLRSSTEYVISDIRLSTASADDTVEGDDEVANPETGANDVVGIAAALAVLSLVAAGAVSLRK